MGLTWELGQSWDVFCFRLHFMVYLRIVCLQVLEGKLHDISSLMIKFMFINQSNKEP
ncbi:hypothetical protein HanIR_Chr01g0018261 [Helianthus annuus]|nr:hypothetical protein HanIR_Chr01g0018261 [Helianthus annuus]